ncbi:minichromosome maintenance domain-containing protein 2 [Sitodiplosis mosellana]|uniref:minichromosome maintenance domain-containing protein 2 n=1 Tax=Sitodiplosis mosellana TaxID=263140 RepID=UPI002444434A|nr:minichromosome maintenance domain-containing protein 2 [Sitodiplosis mosellana]
MSFDTGLASQSSQNSQSSFGLGDYDLLDIDQPPTCSSFSFPLPKARYPSQLILPKKQSNSDIDSGFDFTSSASTETRKSQASVQLLASQRVVSRQKDTVSISDDSFNSNDTETDSELERHAQSQGDGQRHEWSNSSGSQEADYGECYDEEMPLSGVTTAEEEENREQSQQLSDMPNFILPEFDSILKLYSKIKSQYSDCAFVYALASNMCKDLYPKNSYISLKTALLLSIVSCDVRSDAQPISIMAITRDSEIASSVMRRIGDISRRFICINDDLKFNGKCSHTKTIDSNSLLMARNGVCFIGDWLGLKPASLNYLQNVMDSSRVTADSTSNIAYALKCAIWMYWSCSAKKMSQNQKDLTSISKLFGIPVVLDETPSQEVIDFLFAQCAINQTDKQNDVGDNIDENTIKAYLNFVSRIPTQFDVEALSMLKFYFIITRSIRPNILTPTSFDILQRLSECHAKLCLRTEVLKIDVTYAIELFEEFVLSVFAGQVITKPMPNLMPSTYEQVDDNMRKFVQWLDGYMSKINENVHTFFQERL